MDSERRKEKPMEKKESTVRSDKLEDRKSVGKIKK